jgi:hypothetical protein
MGFNPTRGPLFTHLGRWQRIAAINLLPARRLPPMASRQSPAL